MLIIVMRLAVSLLFLLGGIRVLSEGLKAISGGLFHRLLKRYSKTNLRGFSLGVAATFLLQSSSAVSVVVIGFINGGILSLRQGICIIIGANVGTTLTSQLFSFEVRNLLFPLAVVGLTIVSIEKLLNKKMGGSALVGIGLLLGGIEMLTITLQPLALTVFFKDIIAFSKNAIWKGILTGILIAGVLQSSSVTVGMAILLAQERIYNLSQALAIMLGADLGTCITSLLASVGTILPARQLAFGQLAFNFLSAIIILPIWPFFIAAVEFTAAEPGRQVANGHLLYNILGAAALLPFVDQFVALCKRGKNAPKKIKRQDNCSLLKKL